MDVKSLSKERLYLLALSGGADSIALALMMMEQGLRIHALHCNFHLRGSESDRDEDFVRHFCLKNDIPLEVAHFDTFASARRHGASIEMEARELRYTWFAERAHALQAEAVCVAHHMDDQAETLLLNLIRGTGLRGLSAMHPDRTINGLRILRPLLGLDKEDILRYLASRQQEYVTDSTNMEREALRNRIRLDVMPLLREINPNITATLARTAHNVRMETDTESEESRYHRWLAPLGFTRQQILDIYAHRPENPAQTTDNAFCNTTGRLWHSATHTLLQDRGKWILKEKNTNDTTLLPTLFIEKIPADRHPSSKDFLDRSHAFIDADTIKGPLILRHTAHGDRFRPYGMHNGTKLVSDYLTDRKVNLLDKKSQLVAIDTCTNSIVWLVGREIDHRYRITARTTNILRIGCL